MAAATTTANATTSNTDPGQRETPRQMLDRLDFTVLRKLDGLLQGDYRTVLRGAGIDFSDLRDYQHQDDMRHIDWNVTARMNSPFVRQYVEDREVTAWFLLDRSASMAFGGDPSKEQMLADTVVSLARLLSNAGNRVGAVLWNNQVQSVIEPRGGRNQILRLTKALQVSPDATPIPTNSSNQTSPTQISPSQTDLARLGHAALASIRRRSLVFVISDFVSEPGWERPLARLAQRHDVIGVRIVDPAETELPNAGLMVVEDAETGEQLFIDTSDSEFRQRFAEAAVEREAMVAACARRARVDLHAISTSDDVVRAIISIVQSRKKRVR